MAETLNQLDFHGAQLRAEETTFNFQYDDNEYSPKGIGCSSCKYAIQYKNQKSPHTNRYYESTPSSSSPPPYTIDPTLQSSLKRKCSTHSNDHSQKHSKSNNQIYYIESDSSNDSTYSPINVKVEPTL